MAGRGRMGWQRASGYDFRASVEADTTRRKRAKPTLLREP
jgi:hypothetical protein